VSLHISYFTLGTSFELPDILYR